MFYSAQAEPIAFDIQRMDVVAGADVAFVTALMQCAEKGQNGERVPLDFRLTLPARSRMTEAAATRGVQPKGRVIGVRHTRSGIV